MSTNGQQRVALEAESAWAAFSSRVQETLERLSQSGEPVSFFALVDTRGLPELRAAMNRLQSVPFVALWDETDLAAHQDLSPLLIHVDPRTEDAGATQAVLQHLWQISDTEFMVTWICSARDLKEVADHLRRYCEYTLPDRRAYYLHFYDNRVLERLRSVWMPDEFSGFASIACELWYQQRAGEPGIWRSDAETPVAKTDEPLAMTHEQHLALLSLGRVDKVVMQLRGLYGPLLEHFSPGQIYLAARTQLERATVHGVKDEADMLLYVAKGLLVSARFDEHPKIHEQLQLARYGDIPFSEVLSQVDSSIVDDLSNRKAQT
ncbi:MAG: DUF4123 domain-containing protein [Cupriavidus sp.]|nr:DUF4123 domain-containing protein [Cupriavidus sp.]